MLGVDFKLREGWALAIWALASSALRSLAQMSWTSWPLHRWESLSARSSALFVLLEPTNVLQALLSARAVLPVISVPKAAVCSGPAPAELTAAKLGDTRKMTALCTPLDPSVAQALQNPRTGGVYGDLAGLTGPQVV